MIIQYTTHCMMISSGCRNLEILCFIGMLQSSAAIGANVFCFILPTYSIKCSFCWSCYMRYWAIQRVLTSKKDEIEETKQAKQRRNIKHGCYCWNHRIYWSRDD
ncbi:uncharacterized protein LOC107483499 [Arachis duranensis]|uniref:Uncharacterized protein LOC107483499 n=1 Tax=Arachis duranensis TaxID=130453 RepID=A0A9C6WPI0_ARADU|nr:uncharacterized protein LOC107483499 [Arachis duranensis]